jgi:hypothetical protein
MSVVFIPSSLRRYTAGQSKVEVSGGNINEIIEDLERQYPGVKSRRPGWPLSPGQSPQGSGLPHLRRESRRYRTHRLRAVLRDSP